jgi:hypothetical protein
VSALNLLMIFIATLLTSNIALTYPLGMCPFTPCPEAVHRHRHGYGDLRDHLDRGHQLPIYHLALPLKASDSRVVFIITIAAVFSS